jgi:hypothetical protein
MEMGEHHSHDYSEIFNSIFRIPKPQDNLLALTSMFAVGAGSLGIHLQDIPNQPFRFYVSLIFILSNTIDLYIIG